MPRECYETPCGGRLTFSMSERDYQTSVKALGPRLGVDNPFDHPEFMADVERLEPDMAVRSLPRKMRIHLASGRASAHPRGRLTRFGRASFTKAY